MAASKPIKLKAGLATRLPLEQITFGARRQRSAEESDVSDLVASIEEFGQITPIAINLDGELIAGWRRYHAMKELNYAEIDVLCLDVSGLDKLAVEFAENYVRRNLNWQDECAAVARFVFEKRQIEPEFTNADAAAMMGMSPSSLADTLLAADYALANWESAKGKKKTDALQIMRRKARENKTDIEADIMSSVLTGDEDFSPEFDEGGVTVANLFEEESETDQEECQETEDEGTSNAEDKTGRIPTTKPKRQPTASKPKAPVPTGLHPVLVNDSCYDWASSYSGEPFNFLHLDPPYGIGVTDNTNSQSSRNNVTGEGYSDTPDDFIRALVFWLGDEAASVVNQDHCTAVVWHTPQAWPAIKAQAIRNGWTYMPFPFIWHKSDNKGVIPNPAFNLRRTYEQAMILFKGTVVTQNLAGSLAAPSKNSGLHPTEKPIPVVSHLLSALSFHKMRLLDPFAGSANILRASLEFDDMISESVGVEQSKEFFEASSKSLQTATTLHHLSKKTKRPGPVTGEQRKLSDESGEIKDAESEADMEIEL